MNIRRSRYLPAIVITLKEDQSLNGGIPRRGHCLAHPLMPSPGIPLNKSPCRQPSHLKYLVAKSIALL